MATKSDLTSDDIAGCLGASVDDVSANWPLVQQALAERGMADSPTQIAAIATVGVEAGGFKPIEEFGDADYFTRMYENRPDLGNVRKGDGVKYHGRGYIQLTGRANYHLYGEKLGLPLEQKPKLALDPPTAAAILAVYFADHGIPAAAATGDWESVRRRVNGGLNGWPRFRELVRKLAAAAGVDDGEKKKRVGPRTLTLTSPYMKGPDVVKVQRALGVPDDGEYGPVTASAVADWKRRSGYPDKAIDGVLATADLRWLLGRQPIPPGYTRRAQARQQALASSAGVGERAATTMEEWASSGYCEKPAGSNKVPQLVKLAGELGVASGIVPMGFAWCGFSAFLSALAAGGTTAGEGLRELHFNALYCPAILAEAQSGRFGLRVIPQSQAARGDLVLFDWGPGGDPVDHVARLVKPPEGGTVTTVDGNSGPDSLHVIVRERPLNLVRAFARDS
jgi:predicted chitinase